MITSGLVLTCDLDDRQLCFNSIVLKHRQIVRFKFLNHKMDGIFQCHSKKIIVGCILISFVDSIGFSGDKEDPRYSGAKSSMMMRKALSDLSKNTHKFVRETNELLKKAEYFKYRSFVEERESYRSGFGEKFQNKLIFHFEFQ